MVMVLLLDLGRVSLALFLDELLFLFRYPVGSGRALLAGTLSLRYCFDRFACRTCGKFRRLLLVVVVGSFTGLVVLVSGGQEFD